MEANYEIIEQPYSSISDETIKNLKQNKRVLICRNSQISSSLKYAVYDFKFSNPLLAKLVILSMANFLCSVMKSYKVYKSFSEIGDFSSQANISISGREVTILRGYTHSSDLSNVRNLDFPSIYINVFKRLLFHTPETNILYVPGRLHRDCKFYKSPLCFGYVELASALFSKECCITIKIFSRGFETWNNYDIVFKAVSAPNHNQAIIFIQNLIEFLNRLVNDFETINSINLQKLTLDSFNLTITSDSNIIYAINSLDICGFEVSHSNPGKDNSFWTEYEVKNLPSSVYLRKVFTNIISKHYRTYDTDYGLLAIGETSKYWDAWHPRRSTDGDGRIRDLLLYEAKSQIDNYQALLAELQN